MDDMHTIEVMVHLQGLNLHLNWGCFVDQEDRLFEAEANLLLGSW